MKNKNDAVGLRQELRKDLRKQDLQKRFKEHRFIMRDIQMQTDQQEFNQVYPNIDEDNYMQYLDFFLKYLYNDQYNFMLLQLTGYIYQYLLYNPEKPEGYIILEGLSHFEEIQIPQTEEFAEIISNHLFVQGKAIMNIVTNLLSYPKYATCLRQYLYQQNFIQKAEKYIVYLHENQRQTEKQLYINYLFISICTYFITTHPILPHSNLETLAHKLCLHSSTLQQHQLIIQALSELSSSSKPDPKTANILFHNFKNILMKQYFNYELQIITFAIYCIRSKIKIDHDVFHLLLKSLQSSRSQALQKILIFLLMALETFKEELDILYYQNLKDNQVQLSILSIFSNSSISIKIQCIHIFEQLVSFLVKDQHEFLQSIIQKVIECLQQQHYLELSNSSLLLLHKILYHIVNSQQLQKTIYLKMLSQNNFQSKILNLKITTLNAKILQEVFNMYNLIKQNQEIL